MQVNDALEFRKGGEPGEHFGEAILLHIRYLLWGSCSENGVFTRVIDDCRLNGTVDADAFIDTDAAAIAGIVALLAANRVKDAQWCAVTGRIRCS